MSRTSIYSLKKLSESKWIFNHLRNQWQKSLDKFHGQFGTDLSVKLKVFIELGQEKLTLFKDGAKKLFKSIHHQFI